MEPENLAQSLIRLFIFLSRSSIILVQTISRDLCDVVFELPEFDEKLISILKETLELANQRLRKNLLPDLQESEMTIESNLIQIRYLRRRSLIWIFLEGHRLRWMIDGIKRMPSRRLINFSLKGKLD